MKRLFVLALMLLFVTTSGYAGTGDAGDRQADRQADRNALKSILSEIQQALNVNDMDALLKPLDDAVVLSFMTTEVAVGKAQIRAYYEKMFKAKNAPLKAYSTHAEVSAPAIFHGDTAVAYGRAKDKYTLQNGGVYGFDTRWTAISTKSDNRWKVIAINFSVDPFNNVVLDEIEIQFWLYVLLVFVAGGILAVLILRLRKSSP